jgi:hypothetical protein
LEGRYARLLAGDEKAFVDPTALRKYVAEAEVSFNQELAKQRAQGQK